MEIILKILTLFLVFSPILSADFSRKSHFFANPVQYTTNHYLDDFLPPEHLHTLPGHHLAGQALELDILAHDLSELARSCYWDSVLVTRKA